MRRKTILQACLIFIVLFGVLGFFYMQQLTGEKQQVSVFQTPSAHPSSLTTSRSPVTKVMMQPGAESYCTQSSLQASLVISHAAGNVYGTFKLENISPKKCLVLGGEFISVNYDTSAVKNITVNHIGQTQTGSFALASGQLLYSQVHYPNGPQCQSVGLNSASISFTYRVSPAVTITFKNRDGTTGQIVQTCKSPTDMTVLQIWQMATQPITP